MIPLLSAIVAACAAVAPSSMTPTVVRAIAIRRIGSSPLSWSSLVGGDSATFREKRHRKWVDASQRPSKGSWLVGPAELAVVPGGDPLRVEVDHHALRG